MFFAHGVVEITVWQPFVAERYEPELEVVNGLAKKVNRVTKRARFVDMRHAFVNLAMEWPIERVSVGIAHVAALSRHLDSVDRRRLTGHPDHQLAPMLGRLLDSDINVVRNAVAHKTAERPTASKATALFNEARDLVWGLAEHLRLRFPAI